MSKNIANRECVNVCLYDYATKEPFTLIDYANVGTTELTSNRVFAKGGWGAPNRVTFDGERGGTLTIETQIMPMKLYQMMSGNPMKTVAEVTKREVLTLTSNKLTLTNAPVANSVFVYAEDDDFGTSLDATVSGSNVTVTGGTDGEDYIVYYFTTKSTGLQRISFTSKGFPTNYAIEGETLFRGDDGIDYPMLLKAYKVSPQPNFSLSLSNSGDPTSLSLVFDLLADENDNMLDLTLIEEE